MSRSVQRFILSVALTCVLVACLRAAEPIRGLRIGKATTVLEGPLQTTGFPDYAIAIQRQMKDGVAQDQNFWCGFCVLFDPESVHAKFLAELRCHNGFEQAGTRPFADRPRDQTKRDRFYKELEFAYQEPVNENKVPLVIEWLDSNQAALNTACDVSQRPHAYFPFVPASSPLLMAELDHLQQARHVADALSIRARLAITRGKLGDASRDVLAIFRIARHVEKGRSGIHLMMSGLIDSIGRGVSRLLLIRSGASAEEIARHWEVLEPVLADHYAIEDAHDFERLSVLEMTLRCRASRQDVDKYLFNESEQRGDGTEEKRPLIGSREIMSILRWKLCSLIDVNDQLEFINNFHDRNRDILLEPTYQARLERYRQLEEEYLAVPELRTRRLGLRGVLDKWFHSLYCRLRNVHLRKFAVDLAQLDSAATFYSQRTRLLAAAVLAEQHYRATGEDVADGDELLALHRTRNSKKPRFDPRDLYMSKPLLIRREMNELVIYSVGPNNRDDGGMEPQEGSNGGDLCVRLPRPLP